MKPRIYLFDGLWICMRCGTRSGYSAATTARHGARDSYQRWKWNNPWLLLDRDLK